MSEDAWQGDAQFTATLDGVSLGAPLSVTALHGLSQSQAFSFSGSFGSGTHNVGVSFLNDAYGGSASTDRNLYVDSIDYDGTANPSDHAVLYSAGTTNFAVPSSPASITPANNTLALHMSEDAWQGNAQFVASLDGNSLGERQTVTASHGLGQVQDFSFAGVFGPGVHDLAVSFLNDAYGGSAGTDRNLYLNSVDLNGTHYASAAGTMYSNGTYHFLIGTPPTS